VFVGPPNSSTWVSSVTAPASFSDFGRTRGEGPPGHLFGLRVAVVPREWSLPSSVRRRSALPRQASDDDHPAQAAEGTGPGGLLGSVRLRGGDLFGLFGCHGRRGQQELYPFQGAAVGRAEQAVIANLVEPFGQHMLQKPADEFRGRQAGGSPLPSARVFVAEADSALIDLRNPAVGDGHPVDIAPQVVQDLLAPLRSRLAIHHPVFVPQGLRKGQFRVGLARQGHELGAEDPGQSLDRDQVAFAGGEPFPFFGKSAGRNQTMDMGMEDHGPAPGVQHGEQPDLSPDIMPVGRQLHQRLRRRLHQDTVEGLLVATHRFPQGLEQGEDGVGIGNRQQLGLPFCQPAGGVGGVAFGTAAMAAGMIDRVTMTAASALGQLAAETLGATGRNIPQGAAMTGQQAPAELLQVVSAVDPEDFSQFGHDRTAITGQP